jgi:hypothetical protein
MPDRGATPDGPAGVPPGDGPTGVPPGDGPTGVFSGTAIVLNPLQRAAVEAGLFASSSNFVLDFPTGAGKTWLVTRMAARAVAEGRSCVISVPLRALAAELYERLARELPRGTAALCTGAGRRGRPWREGACTVATHESFLLRARPSNLAWLSTLSFAAFDEIHLLEQPGRPGQPARGALLEALIVRLFRLAPWCRIVALSATLDRGDPRLCAWLEAACVRGAWRPVPLTLREVACEAGRREQALEELLTGDPRPTLVFLHSRRRCEMLARRLLSLGVSADVHHAGLSARRQARVLEGLVAGAVRVVVATPTLEMGLNLPVDRVICPELVFPGAAPGRWERIPARTLHQRLGRAGRPGLGTAGEGIVLVRAGARERVLDEPFAPLESALPGELDAFVLRELGAGLCASRPQLERALALTFAARCGAPLPVEDALEKLAGLGLLREESARGAGRVPRLRLTPLGVAAAAQFGPVTRFAGACGLLQRDLTVADLLWIAHACVVQETYFSPGELARLAGELDGLPSSLLTSPAGFEVVLGVSRRQAVVSACAVAALLAWRRVPKQARDDHVFWGASYEACRLRAWHAHRVLLAVGRLLRAVPDFPAHPATVDRLGEAQEVLRLRGPLPDPWEGSAGAPVFHPPAQGDPPAGPDAPRQRSARLRRALECSVEPLRDGDFAVTHRGAAHRVADGACDCPDFSPKRPCKHVLAVGLRGTGAACPGETGPARPVAGAAPFDPLDWWREISVEE